ncbi:restriction endonuclease [Virgibacillus halodenitrificans]|uniref:restriction endonuclease n=1 Tax=Virgibacillus halodenitrificans TaxID=1482 RepID=UPI00031518AE|nr:restriction endonuclease [Virgibacillus halodenitrificans]
MNKKDLLTKTKLSELAGWSESNGRRWMKNFKEYIPSVNRNNRERYTKDSLKKLKFLKKISEMGMTIPEIKEILVKEGFPQNEKEEIQFIEKYRTERYYANYDESVKNTIPSTGEMMIPYLNAMKDRSPHSASEITEYLVHYFRLTDEQRFMKYEGNTDIILLSRIRNVRYSLKKEDYIEEVNKLTYKITQKGVELLKENKQEIEGEIEELEKNVDPLLIVKEKLNDLKDELASNLLKKLTEIHWMKFEDIVVELLTKMGYGDGEVTQRTNDEGLDGLIKEDKLGLENIYIQAKKYAVNRSIGRDAVQSFSGALDGKGARKGVFLTTSYFTANAIEYAKSLAPKKIILIEGTELAKLMINYGVGVNVSNTFSVKEIDYDYFKND